MDLLMIFCRISSIMGTYQVIPAYDTEEREGNSMHSSVKNKKPKNLAITVWISVCLLLLSIAGLVLARTTDGFAQWYAANLYPLFQNTLGRSFSQLPFSVFEIGLYTGASVLALGLLRILFVAATKPRSLMAHLSRSAKRAFCLASCLLLLFTLTGSINYSRAGFAETAGLKPQPSSDEDLAALARLLIEDIAELEALVPFDEKGEIRISNEVLKEETQAAMKNLGGQHPALSGYYPDPKPVLLSRHMSSLGITGIFSPFTMEANYNTHVPGYVIPYTVCHELAHFKGFMKEDEAGFIAYLACRDSASPSLRYSGALNALSYTLSALYRSSDPEVFSAVYRMIPDHAAALLDQNRSYWKAHTKPVTRIAEAANDRYLTANAQAGGSKSYGGIVDLLLAEYAGEIS